MYLLGYTSAVKTRAYFWSIRIDRLLMRLTQIATLACADMPSKSIRVHIMVYHTMLVSSDILTLLE